MHLTTKRLLLRTSTGIPKISLIFQEECRILCEEEWKVMEDSNDVIKQQPAVGQIGIGGLIGLLSPNSFIGLSLVGHTGLIGLIGFVICSLINPNGLIGFMGLIYHSGLIGLNNLVGHSNLVKHIGHFSHISSLGNSFIGGFVGFIGLGLICLGRLIYRINLAASMALQPQPFGLSFSGLIDHISFAGHIGNISFIGSFIGFVGLKLVSLGKLISNISLLASSALASLASLASALIESSALALPAFLGLLATSA
jgi:hypothetical protein